MTKEREYQKQIETNNLEITYRLYNDSLTALPNRNKFIIDIKDEVCPIVILININNFKHINAYYGIEMGDKVLHQIAKLYKSVALEYNMTVYRMHSDEFAFLIHEKLSRPQINDILHYVKIRTAEFKFGSKEQTIMFYISAGVSLCNENSLEPNLILLEEADIALKYAKKSNDYYAFYNDAKSLVQTFSDNLVWTKKISEAIKEERIIPHFQPIVDKEGNVVLYEALVRMIDSDENIIYPGEFLDVAKNAKLYPKITRIMAQKVFKIFEHRTEGVSINISYEDIEDSMTVNLLLNLIDKYNISNRVTFEILESESIKNYDEVRGFIETVKKRGCRISIDDFGSGYSNFERMLRLDIDYIKIDGSIIKSIDTDESSRVIAETIVYFAKKSRLKLVAEFVCSQSVSDIVLELEIDYRQGFHLGKPQELS